MEMLRLPQMMEMKPQIPDKVTFTTEGRMTREGWRVLSENLGEKGYQLGVAGAGRGLFLQRCLCFYFAGQV